MTRKYRVTLTYSVPYLATFEVDAETEDAAIEKAFDMESEGEGEWLEDSDAVSQTDLAGVSVIAEA